MYSNRSTRVSFGVYKPRQGFTVQDVIAHITRVAASLEQSSSSINITILRSVRRNWAAVLVESKEAEDSRLNLPEGAAFTKGVTSAVRMAESGWFQLISEQHKGNTQVDQTYSVGDIVSVRRIFVSGGKNQEMMAYCCLAASKAFFANITTMLSYSFYESLDGKRVIGLGKWDNVDSAYGVVYDPNGCPAQAYWDSVGAKKLKYEVCQVVYVTSRQNN